MADISSAFGGGKPAHSENVFTSIMGPVAKHVLGKPTKETAHELRFRTYGSMSIDLDKGTFYDHEAEHGGGVLEFLHHELNLDKPAAMAWLEAHSFIEPKAEVIPFTPRREAATYDYPDDNGTLLFQVVRYEPKDFRQRRPDGVGGWTWSTKGIQLVIYHLPEVLAAVSQGETIYIAEGEKSVDRLRALGFAATCSPGGAGKWRAEYGEALHQADVVILPDNDDAGVSHAENVAWHLSDLASRVRVLELPGLSAKGDVADWIAAGGTAEQFLALVESAPDSGIKRATPPMPNPPAPAKVAKVPALPDGLLDVDGVLGEFVAYVMATSISPQPFLAVAAGLSAIGAVAGRRYRTRTNLRTNIYAVGIADSGGGKDHARKVVKAVFAAANLTDYLGGEEIASGSGLLTSLGIFPCRLYQIDEFGDWLVSILAKNAGAHKKQIENYLRILYTSANTLMTGAEKSDQSDKTKKRQDLQQPHACLYGTTTPSQFWAAMAGASVHNGLLPRFLVCITPESYPERVRPSTAPVPDGLVAKFQAIARGAELVPGEGNLSSVVSSSSWQMASDVVPDPYLVPETSEAAVAIDALSTEEWLVLSTTKDEAKRNVWARYVENSIKLALIRAISRNPAAPVIEKRDIDWGTRFVKHTMATLLSGIQRHVADTDYERQLNKCLDVLRKAGKPLSEYEMVRKGFKISEKERAEILRTLTGSGQVMAISDAGQSGGGGRPTIRYAIQDDAQIED